jgi:hypothetical protein
MPVLKQPSLATVANCSALIGRQGTTDLATNQDASEPVSTLHYNMK